ncbi:MAG: VanW family protein, partial [Actinobacteria bacterium]|nr:VanW family protein [Actinomycetota bacterium]
MTTTPGAPPSSRSFPFGKLILGMITGFTLTLAFGAGALLAYQGQYADRVHPGVTVDGVDISGLTRAAATARLQDRLARYAEGSAVIAIDTSEVRITYAALGRRADVDKLVELAWSVGRDGGDPLGRAAQGVRSLLDGTHIDPIVVLDPAAVQHAVAEAALDVYRAPVSGSATVTATGFAASPAVPGKELPRVEITAALLAQLTDPAAPDTLELAYQSVPVEPDIDDAEVASAIASANRMATDVALTSGKETWTIKAATVRAWIGFETTPDGYRPTVAPTAPTKVLADLARKIDTAPKDATFLVGRGDSVGVVAGRNGRALDVATSAPLVAGAIADRAAAASTASPPPVALAITVVEPKLSTEEAKKVAPLMRKVSTWTTYYEVSERNGFSNNITIPARDLDGTVVAPGAVFDFWKSIGPVTAARGYRYGGAIIHGHSQPTGALGGGICSTSTTLFNAVVRPGYQMLARHNHYYYITRYPTGLDATVAIEGTSVTTMSWKNDSQYPVMIRSSARPGVVSFSLYAVAVNNRPAVGGGSRIPGSTNVTYRVANGRTVTFATSAKRNYDGATSSVQRTTSLPPGHVKV